MAVVASRDPDPDKCEHYAQFAAKLQPLKFDIAYWILFLLVMLMLFCSSWYYGRYVLPLPGSIYNYPPLLRGGEDF